MFRYVLNRILWLISIVLAATIVVFAIVHLSGDPTNGFVEPGASPEVRAQIRHNLGLDDPLVVQYAHFVGHAATGDFGTSWRADQPAFQLVIDRLGATLILAGAALSLAVLLGIGMGAAIARNWRGSGGALSVLVSVGMALPSFWVGATLVLLFAVNFGW
ncbi:MAG TPA: ABC transporter permease, partial [Thermomicrobiales bacterium]|nr:ABC transporter permease [Thermomicrobiales bacterium]